MVVAGPSGVGKSSVIEGLAARIPFHFSVSMTTRTARPGEVDGVDYHFVDRDRFTAAIAAGELVEWAEYGGDLYGTPYSEVEQRETTGRDVVLNIDLVGARNVKRTFPDAILFFIVPPGLDELERRLRERGDTSEEAVRRRLEIARVEMEQAPSVVDHVVVNDELDAAVARVADLLGADPDPTDRSP